MTVTAAEIQTHLNAGEKAAPQEVVDYVKAKGVASLKNDKIVEFIIAAVENASSLPARETGLAAVTAISKEIGGPATPFMTALLPVILTAYADKAPTVRTAAASAGKSFISVSCGSAQGLLLPPLFDAMEVKRNWQTKVGALQLLEGWSKSAPVEVALSLPEIIPVASGCLADAKPQVKNAAIKALTSASAAMGNKDIENLVPAVISAMANPAQVPDTVHKLGATTFVAAVTASTLSLLVPLLVRGLRDRSTPIKRKACLVIDNMSKLVNNPADAAVFLPRLLPGLDAVRNEVANPECREVADKAHATLMRVGAKGKVATQTDEEKASEAKMVKKALAEVIANECSGKKVDDAVIEYVGEGALFQLHIKVTLLAIKVIDEPEKWNPRAVEAVTPFLEAGLTAAEAKKVGQAFIDRIENEDDLKTAANEVDEEDGEPLTPKPLKFSLAYGAKILLNNAVLNLKRGKRYGLCGPNGCGKSTLMRSIANGQVKEFPPQDELKTVYVEHDIDAEETQQSVINYVASDSQLLTKPRQEIEDTLNSVGFTLEMREKPIASLSGGWKMKLALARAMLWNADILLLDEPTNHLDVTNVAWLENYLTHLPTVTSIIVSHDSGFLDNVCTGIIHYEDLRLSQYRGNLSEFVKQKPEARSYYELSNLNLKFRFPEPGFLEGVKSKDRAILKMAKCGIRYPGMTKNVVSNVTLQCSLNSRIAILGANGAGKSTMVKALIGELNAHEGTVWKHPNLRVAYVAQHAFHHIEKHMDKTPNQYIQWRYATGEDREGADSVFRKATKEEEDKMAAAIKMADGTKKIVEKIDGRRKLKRGYEYEVQWKNLPMDKNEWLTRDQLEEMGFGKTLNDIDIKEAAKAGLVSRPLTEVMIAKHLKDLGIEEEFGNHAHIRGLSGGQKVKCVLAAATWMSPHIIVLDEPTNYLDRDALGALAEAIKDYGGGIIMISHSSEFTSALCPEKWIVADGKLAIEGQTEAQKEQAKLEWKRQEEMTDAFGNTIKVKAPKKKLSNKEKKQRAKVRAARRDRGEEVSESEEDE